MNMTVMHKPLIVRPHPREAEISCLPPLMSMNNPKTYDPATHFDSMQVPTMYSPPAEKGQRGRPRTRPAKIVKVAKVQKSTLILADDYLNMTADELALKHDAHISYVRRVLRTATGAAPRQKVAARPNQLYLDILAEHEAGASRPALKGKYGLNDKQLSYGLIKGKRLRGEGSLLGAGRVLG
ncbi:MAG TPA: hypothetical protein DD666_00590 [Advenella kashmirensis]|uniref:Uncharacterized protein n=1 Tax=Advenella kashmirensis TaxID=310575 RepID=A0A356LA63_9BURK|nr:hypothetical protein [Advenella kashmirensis]